MVVTLDDLALIEHARLLILRKGKLGQHHVAAALRLTTGEVFTGLHVSVNLGVGSICAEAAAIAEALKSGEIEISTIVAVRHTFNHGKIEIVPPCGHCRQLILEYGHSAQVLLSLEGELTKVPICDLLPFPFKRR